MIFEKKSPKSFCNLELGIEIRNSQYYILADEGQNIGHFYCGQNQSIGIYKESTLLITRSQNTFAALNYDLRNLNNNALVGHISISSFVARKSLKAEIDIIHKDSYKWEVIDASKGFSLFASKTWSTFLGRLCNNNEVAEYMWDYESHRVYAYKLENLPVTGRVKMTNEQNHFLLFAGLFLMEMELQLKAVD